MDTKNSNAFLIRVHSCPSWINLYLYLHYLCASVFICGDSSSLLWPQHLDLDVPELNFHLRAGVLLERDDAALQRAGIFVDHLAGDMTVNLHRDVRAVGD